MKYCGLQVDIFQDMKVKKLIKKHGSLGFHLYVKVITLIAAKTTPNNLTTKLEYDFELLADEMGQPLETIERIMLDMAELKLLYREEDFGEGAYYCPKILQYSDKAMRNHFQTNDLEIVESVIKTLIKSSKSVTQDAILSHKVGTKWEPSGHSVAPKEEKRKEEKRKEVEVKEKPPSGHQDSDNGRGSKPLEDMATTFLNQNDPFKGETPEQKRQRLIKQAESLE